MKGLLHSYKKGCLAILKFLIAKALPVFFLFWHAACSAPGLDFNTEIGRKAIITEVNLALQSSKCTRAIDLIEPLYESEYTDDEVRFLRASAHACRAGINYFEMLDHLTTNSMIVPDLWNTITDYFFNSTPAQLDSRLTASFFSMDALQAILIPGVIIAAPHQVAPNTENVGSVLVADRTDDSNSFLMLVAMSSIGAYQSREGNPNLLTFTKQQPMANDTYAEVGEEDCGYAGSINNMLDGISAVGNQVSGTLGANLVAISTAIQTAIDDACNYGCQALDWDGVTPVAADAASCAFAAGTCSPCPTAIRTRTSCATDNESRCAAAGIIRFMNNSPLGWQ